MILGKSVAEVKENALLTRQNIVARDLVQPPSDDARAHSSSSVGGARPSGRVGGGGGGVLIYLLRMRSNGVEVRWPRVELRTAWLRRFCGLGVSYTIDILDYVTVVHNMFTQTTPQSDPKRMYAVGLQATHTVVPYLAGYRPSFSLARELMISTIGEGNTDVPSVLVI